MPDNLTAKDLRKKFESIWPGRDWYHEGDKSNLALRIHRAISWVERAEREANDLAPQFIFYWIAFNAAYGRKIPGKHVRACKDFKIYFDKVVNLDRICLSRIINATRKGHTVSDSIKNLLGNTFIFQPRWDDHNSKDPPNNWMEDFDKEREEYEKAINAGDTRSILSVLFGRLYILRNQLVHGGSSSDSDINPPQLKVGTYIMKFLIPIFIDLMIDSRYQNTDWEPLQYPRIPFPEDERYPEH